MTGPLTVSSDARTTGRATTAGAERADLGVLRPCGLDEDGPTTIDAELGRLHHRLRVHVAACLAEAALDGWEVSAGCCWDPLGARRALRPDVVVHRALEGDGRLTRPPVLCVDIAAGPAGPRPASTYAQLGVDHHWHLDSRHRTLQVSVRVGDVYRRCESWSAGSLVRPAGSSGSDWVDFGVGVAHLGGLLDGR